MRWFRREIGRGLAQRLFIETLVVAGVVGAIVGREGATRNAIIAAGLTAPLFAAARWGLGCLTNATSSTYLNSWPHPSGELTSVPQANIGHPIDIALTAAGLRFYDAYSEWGGSVTSVYGSHDPLLVMTSGQDDLQVICGLTDGRLCVTTTQLIPPHEQLIINHEPSADVNDLLTSHAGLIEMLETQGAEVADAAIHFVVDLLALEWEAWQQVGPLLAPFVDIDHRLHPSILTVRVSTHEVRDKGLSSIPFVRTERTPTNRELGSIALPEAPTDPEPASTVRETSMTEAASTFPTVTVTPASTPDPSIPAFAALRDQAHLAAEQTDRAVSRAKVVD